MELAPRASAEAMRSLPLTLALVAALTLAGCAARGADDPFGYMRKPLYASSFDLSSVQGSEKTHGFEVEDGSIAQIKVQVWVNATTGNARVIVKDPSGQAVVDSTQSKTIRVPLNLGRWTITVEGSADATGDVGAMVTRT